MFVFKMRKYIKQLRNGCAPGVDGIVPEYLKFSLDSDMPLYLSNLLSVCMVFGIVPDSLCEGILLPIIKKTTAGPGSAKNYRQITLSVIFSKLLEYHILDLCTQLPSLSQFGFIPGRGTNMAISLVNDISAICNSRGSTVFILHSRC